MSKTIEQPESGASLLPRTGSAANALTELRRRVEYCEPVFAVFVGCVDEGQVTNALYHILPLLRELELCRHDCMYLVEQRRLQKQQNAALTDPAAKPKETL